jgi:hypothetical protein
MQKGKSGIMHLRLTTKNRRGTSKYDTMVEEIARLERANGYIKNEVKQKPYIARNKKRIKYLKKKLLELELKE